MKQNQSLFRPFPGEATSVKPHDLLSVGASCSCSRCSLIRDSINPQIQLDADLQHLRRNNIPPQRCDQVVFLGHFQSAESHLPRFRFLDTIVLEEGKAVYAIYFEQGRAKVSRQVNMKNWLAERKEQMDLRYQVKKYQRENPSFHFAAFEHESQKRIKEFQNNIRYKVPPILNRIAIVKLRGITEEKLLTLNQFQDLFSITKQKVCELMDIEYMQVFPIMYGEEDSSYTRSIKYFRAREAQRKGFRLAESNVCTWREKNDSLEKMEEHVYDEIAKAEHTQVSETMRLQYMTYKILIYFEEISNLRIEEAIVHYITNDQGRTFYFRKIECIRLEKRIPIDDIGVELPTKRDIAPEDHINLRGEMRKLFEGFQQQFQRLDKERQDMESKMKKDKEYSNFVFKTITQKNGDSLHKILLSNNQKYKKEQLKL